MIFYSPYGHYFVSAGQDRVARLWSTDHHQPLRMFAGHLSDVDVSICASRTHKTRLFREPGLIESGTCV